MLVLEGIDEVGVRENLSCYNHEAIQSNGVINQHIIYSYYSYL